MVRLKRLNAQLVRLSSSYRQRLLVDSAGHDLIAGEHPSLHHLLRNRKRKENRPIRQVVDDNDERQTTSMTVLTDFAAHFRQSFQSIESQDQCAEQLLECELRSIPPGYVDSLIHPLTLDELWRAVAQGKPRKAPGTEGICLEFYRAAWDVIKDDLFQIMNCMVLNGLILDRQVQGQTVCTPEKPPTTTIGDYRALTLLNVDYKILARGIANRLKPILPEIMHPQQHCGVPGTTVFDAVATIRDAIAYADSRKIRSALSL